MYLSHTHTDVAGFSLVETLVAIAILLIVIVGPMSIASQANISTNFANQQVTAYFLAQEGLELVQKGRDDLLLPRFDGLPLPPANNTGWDAFTSVSGRFADCYTTAGCGLEIDETVNGSLVITDCDLGTTTQFDCQLYLTDDLTTRAQYTHTISSTATDYIRVITIDETVANQEVLVTSEVLWRTGNQIQDQSVVATTYLFNVYGR